MTSTYAGNNTPPLLVEDWGFYSHLTVVQEERLREFRAALEAQEDTRASGVSKWPDQQLLRFMRARDFNVKKALKMINEDLDWRKLFAGRRLERSLFAQVFEFHLNGLVKFAGKDKDGRPVVILRTGRFYPRKVRDMMEIVNFFVLYVEGLVHLCDSWGFTEFTAIADMEGWSLSENFSLPVSQLMAQLLQDHFPERLRYAFVVRNPFAFSAAFALIAPFLEARVKAKLHVWGKHVNRLKEYIPEDQLERCLGGTRKEDWPVPDIFTERVARGETMIVLPLGGLEPASSSSSSSPPAAPDNVVPPSTASPAPMLATASPPTSSAQLQRQQSSSGRRVDRIRAMLGRVVLSRNASSTSSSNNNSSSSSTLNGEKASSAASPEPDLFAPPAAKPSSAALAEEAARPREELPRPSKTRITIFGATGRTGSLLVESALARGLEVTAFARLHSKIPTEMMRLANAPNSRLTMVVGDVLNPLDVDRAVEGSEVIVCAMGVEPSLLSATGTASAPSGAEHLAEAISLVLDSMERLRSRRIVLISDARCSPSYFDSGAGIVSNLQKMAYWKSHYQFVAKAEESVKARGSKGSVDYTILRPGVLTTATSSAAEDNRGVIVEEGYLITSGSKPGLGTLSRKQLVKYLLEEVVRNPQVTGPLDELVTKHFGKAYAIGTA